LAGASAVFIVSLLIISLGAVLKRIGVFRDEDGQTLARVALNVTLPAVVLSTVPTIALDASLALIPLICLAHCGVVLAAGFRLFRTAEDRTKAVLLMSSTGFNNALFAFPIVEALWGAAGLQRLAMFDVGNALILLGVNYLIASWYGTRAAGGTPRLTFRFVGLNLAKSAPLVSYAVAIGLNLAGLRLPPIVGSFLGILAKANTPVVLLLLGVYLDLRLARDEVRHLLGTLALRYGAGALTGGLCFLFLPYDADYRKVLLVAVLLPVGATVGAFSASFGLNRKLASIATNVTLLVSFALMWLVASLL
jgi:predicted permease